MTILMCSYVLPDLEFCKAEGFVVISHDQYGSMGLCKKHFWNRIKKYKNQPGFKVRFYYIDQILSMALPSPEDMIS